MIVTRRRMIVLAAAALLPGAAMADPARVAALIERLVGDHPLKDGVVHLDVPVMVENGNAVAMGISAADAPSPIETIHVFADGNPLPHVAIFRFGPRSGPVNVATRIRLATSQTVTAIARDRDGVYWRDRVEVLVTLAACIE